MAETEKKIQQLQKKIAAKEARIKKLNDRITAAKSEMKLINKEVDEMANEIRNLELNQLAETLSQNGITTADIAAAIAAGEIKKTNNDTIQSSETTDTNSTSNEEVTNNETGSSGETLSSEGHSEGTRS